MAPLVQLALQVSWSWALHPTPGAPPESALFPLFTLAALALAAEGEPPPAEDEGLTVEVDRLDYLSASDRADAETTEVVSQRKLRWFKPTRDRLTPVNQQVDYTAYVLEPGEVRLGIGTIGVGLLPGTHLSTNVPLIVLGVPNATAKVSVPIGPVAVSARGNGYWMPQSDFSAAFWEGVLQVSVNPVPALGLHVGGSYAYLESAGDFDPAQINPLLTSGLSAAGMADGYTLPGMDVTARVVGMRAAVDVRFNRLHSVVLQAESVLYTEVDAPALDNLPDVLFFDDVLAFDGFVPVTEGYTTSIAYQLTWHNLDVRAGVGLSAVPGAWLLQSVDVAWRFGGATRRKETQMKKGWRANRRELAKERRALRRHARRGGADSEVASAEASTL